MKRCTLLVVGALLALVLTGCSREEKKVETNTTTERVTPQENTNPPADNTSSTNTSTKSSEGSGTKGY